MKKIGFIGAYDKTDLILYVAKILTTLKKKVLIIDATTNQKTRYIIPTLNPTKMYVTEFEEIDLAVGFSNEEEIKKYLGIEEEKQLEYDYIFVDTDNIKGFNTFGLEKVEKNYFITSFDCYSLKKGLELLGQFEKVVALTKVFFTEEMLKEEDDYINFLSLGYKVMWNDSRIYFPIENGDLTVIYENQRLSKIKFKKLSIQYKDGLKYIAEEILGHSNEGNIRRAIKFIEKGV